MPVFFSRARTHFYADRMDIFCLVVALVSDSFRHTKDFLVNFLPFFASVLLAHSSSFRGLLHNYTIYCCWILRSIFCVSVSDYVKWPKHHVACNCRLHFSDERPDHSEVPSNRPYKQADTDMLRQIDRIDHYKFTQWPSFLRKLIYGWLLQWANLLIVA